MWIQHLSLHYFRNLINNEFKFNNKKIIISGKNGTGKTSILEAIYLLSLGRSFRAKKDSNLIHYNSAAGNVAGNFVLQDKEKIDIHLHISNKKIFTINNKSIKRLSQLIGIVNTILFMDKDIDIIERAPELRRKFIDIIFSRVDRKYLSTLIKYYKTLEERNSFLRASIQDQTLLESLNSSLIRYGTEIICLRMNYLKQFLIILKGLIKSYDISIYGDITVKYHTDLFDIDQDTPDGEKDRDLIKKEIC
ncbi:MAG: DNA replication and repair protein RecF [Spirochaetes bacterium]|nr:DNA replication and repair protein RecF [Spirochaetota bacterium]